MHCRTWQAVEPRLDRLPPQPISPSLAFWPSAVPSVGFIHSPPRRGPQEGVIVDDERDARDSGFQPGRTEKVTDLGAIGVVTLAVAFGPALARLLFG